jgi:hypothetical protein
LSVNTLCLPLLERHQLASYAPLVEARGAAAMDYNKKRIFIFRLNDDGKPVSLYLKRHHMKPPLVDRLRRLIGMAAPSDGIREWDNLLAFQRLGLATGIPAAAGARRLPDGFDESFIATVGLNDYAELDTYVAEHLKPPLDRLQLKEKRELIAAVARFTQNMHWRGFNHQDYYLCHFFFKRRDGEPIDLRVIDLQRAGRRFFCRSRWFVKDLAQLHYSSLALPLSGWDRLRFYAVYSARESGRRRRFYLKWALLKSRSIARRDARKALSTEASANAFSSALKNSLRDDRAGDADRPDALR